MPLRSSYAYLYNSRPLKLDPPWSDSHRRRSWTGPSTRSSVSAASRSGWGRQLGGAWKSCAGTMPRVRGRKGWPASCGNWWRTWRRRPGSAAGARDDHEQSFNYSLKATCIFHLTTFQTIIINYKHWCATSRLRIRNSYLARLVNIKCTDLKMMKI